MLSHHRMQESDAGTMMTVQSVGNFERFSPQHSLGADSAACQRCGVMRSNSSTDVSNTECRCCAYERQYKDLAFRVTASAVDFTGNAVDTKIVQKNRFFLAPVDTMVRLECKYMRRYLTVPNISLQSISSESYPGSGSLPSPPHPNSAQPAATPTPPPAKLTAKHSRKSTGCLLSFPLHRLCEGTQENGENEETNASTSTPVIATSAAPRANDDGGKSDKNVDREMEDDENYDTLHTVSPGSGGCGGSTGVPVGVGAVGGVVPRERSCPARSVLCNINACGALTADGSPCRLCRRNSSGEFAHGLHLVENNSTVLNEEPNRGLSTGEADETVTTASGVLIIVDAATEADEQASSQGS